MSILIKRLYLNEHAIYSWNEKKDMYHKKKPKVIKLNKKGCENAMIAAYISDSEKKKQ